jgi:hypothetical protein
MRYHHYRGAHALAGFEDESQLQLAPQVRPVAHIRDVIPAQDPGTKHVPHLDPIAGE